MKSTFFKLLLVDFEKVVFLEILSHLLPVKGKEPGEDEIVINFKLVGLA